MSLCLVGQLDRLEQELTHLRNFKKVLISQAEPLVDAVMLVLRAGLGLACHREEAFREDLELRDAQGQCIGLVEVKGTNRGVQREHVNQADSHRERAGRGPSFPSILIINTNLKAAKLADKDQAVATDQVQHAARSNILILRTLDLLNLAALKMSGAIDAQTVTAKLTSSAGWMLVANGAVQIRQT